MKNITWLSIISSAALLSACATSPKAPAENNQITVNSMPENATLTTETPTTKGLPSSSIKLSAKDGRLVAKLYTNWNGAKQGSLKLHWIAPSQSHCISTTFPIMKYKESMDYSWAYRTLEHESADGSIACPGVWQVEVLYTPTKVVVGKAVLDVHPASTIVPSK